MARNFIVLTYIEQCQEIAATAQNREEPQSRYNLKKKVLFIRNAYITRV